MRNDKIIRRLLDSGQLWVNRDTGKVFSWCSNTPNKPLGSPNKKGYLRTCIHFEGRAVYVLMHRVVWIDSFGLPKDDVAQINHKDTVKAHNLPSNLELMTQAQNMAHAKAHGLARGGWRNARRDVRGCFVGKQRARREWNEIPEADRV